SVQDKQVAILAYAAMRKPAAEGKLHILNEIKEPALQVEPNILGLLSRADRSEEAVDLVISIMKAKPETASTLMLFVSDANPDMLSKHEADFSEISSRTEDARVKELVEKTL